MTLGSIRVGIGGWTFEPWRGEFYPPGLPHKRELEYASRHVTAIEINATYYGRQKPESWRKWAREVPDGFKFSLKASRFSTNRKVLADAEQSVQVFLEQGFTELDDKLGPIVWQFSATKRFERDDFAHYLDFLPDEQDGVRLRHVLEPRHESFADDAFFQLARERNMAVVFADSEEFPRFDETTADFAYARLQRSSLKRKTGYGPTALDQWADKARSWATGGRDVFVYFIAGDKVRDPAAAMALIKRI